MICQFFSFQQQTKDLSVRFRDRPMSPLETAVYWVEYVVRHKGAPFMKTAAVDMPFYQYYLLDVMLFLLVIFTVFFYIIYAILKVLFKLAFRRTQNKMKKS